ncbi:MAG: histidine phosphatase family protein [Gemmatimonadaceae bacterium]|nr:histidine phosphatase family protein [Gemmatimonadaceae bacterium]
MKLLVVRHAIAMDREEFAQSGKSDDLRPLTKKGVKRMRLIASGLRGQIENLYHLASSPLTRALETAAILADAYGIEKAEVTTALSPDSPFEEFETWCRSRAAGEVIAVVGHEPHLSSLVGWLIAGPHDSRLQLDKGGACLLEFDATPRANSGTLIWLLTSRQLRSLGS